MSETLKKPTWTGDMDDDCTARIDKYCLRAECMGDSQSFGMSPIERCFPKGWRGLLSILRDWWIGNYVKQEDWWWAVYYDMQEIAGSNGDCHMVSSGAVARRAAEGAMLRHTMWNEKCDT